MAALKNCPFCKDGGAPEINYGCGGTKAYVKCYGCGIYSPSFKTKKEAEAYWNNRHENTCEGCVHENESRYSMYCHDCTHVNYADFYSPKVVG